MKQLTISKLITNRENASLDKYLQEISKVDLISAQEEVELTKRIKAGDQIALEKLTKANLRFVVSVAKQYHGNGLSLGDLINEGNMGLIKAAQRFDETRGFKFISYAVWWIRQAIMQAIGDNSRIVRIPANRITIANKIHHASSELEQKLQREPSTEELASVLDISDEEIQKNQFNRTKHLSLDAPFAQGEEGSLLDVLEDKEFVGVDAHVKADSLRKEINRSLQKLSERESAVLCSYYGLNGETQLTLDEIGEKYELTRERVRQIKEKATTRLKNNKHSQHLKEYLG